MAGFDHEKSLRLLMHTLYDIACVLICEQDNKMAAINTARMAMASCGINDVAMFNGRTAAERIATETFGDEFHTCMDKSFKELDNELDTFFHSTVAQGQTRFPPWAQFLPQA